jgi:hypothetical protein
MTARYTTAGIRLAPMRRVGVPDEVMNYMLAPGVPGIGSESLADLPEDGSNVQPDRYGMWLGVLVEAPSHFPAL